MKENLTEIILCVDRSGSMRSIAVDMEGGLRQLVADQSAPPGECIVTYVTFDDHYEVEFVARHYLDWESVDSDNYIVTNAGRSGNMPATKRVWHVG